MQTTLETLPASQYALLVTLTYGNPLTIVRYCRWTEDLDISGQVFTAEPSLDVQLGESHGGTEDKPHKLTIVASRTPFATLATGFAFPTISVLVEQIDPTQPTTRRHLASGDVASHVVNPSGRSGLIRCSIEGIKAAIARRGSLSLRLTTDCDVAFGGPHCKVIATSWTRSGTVASFLRNSITLTMPGVTDPVAELPNSRYRKGHIEISGLKLSIKKSLENRTFELFDLVPPWTVGLTATVRAGCDKRLSTCKTVWNNEINFVGLGIKIPNRNPNFQEP